MEIWDFIWRNPWVLIILLPWALSIVGGVFTKAARKSAEQQRRAQRGAGVELQEKRQEKLPEQPKRPEPEQIAAEIRRMMGMEPAAKAPEPKTSRPTPRALQQPRPRVVVLEEEWEEAPALAEPPPEPAARPQAGHLGGLRERMAARATARRTISKLAGRHIDPATEHGGVHERHLQTGLMRKLRSREGRGAGRRMSGLRAAGTLADLSDPVKAFVMLEILGPPKGLQGME